MLDDKRVSDPDPERLFRRDGTYGHRTNRKEKMGQGREKDRQQKFKKLLDNDEEQESRKAKSLAKQAPGPSIFDLAKGPSAPGKVPTDALVEEPSSEGIPLPKGQEENVEFREERRVVNHPGGIITVEREQVEVPKKDAAQGSDVNLGTQDPSTPLAKPVESKERPVTPRQHLRLLVEKMVETLTEMQKSQETTTSITLKHPPLFAGAKITLQEFASARGEYNVTFSNLSPEAKALLDIAEHQVDLRNSMKDRGFPLHIIRTDRDDIHLGAGDYDPRGADDTPREDLSEDGQGKRREDDEEIYE